jgi:hypothetical protein
VPNKSTAARPRWTRSDLDALDSRDALAWILEIIAYDGRDRNGVPVYSIIGQPGWGPVTATAPDITRLIAALWCGGVPSPRAVEYVRARLVQVADHIDRAVDAAVARASMRTLDGVELEAAAMIATVGGVVDAMRAAQAEVGRLLARRELARAAR